ncbi:polysaccharide deacetylase family protein [Halalkalibacillus halophilus]|uniref:polysaccharide deacetylase family protein n=1 Tax=Halalkalibacillus halophilus TaxID=392827 RepID=UPI000412BE5C|nr:polysaccharide deacetylase family protein [Halalkalibacillus halophilus]
MKKLLVTMLIFILVLFVACSDEDAQEEENEQEETDTGEVEDTESTEEETDSGDNETDENEEEHREESSEEDSDEDTDSSEATDTSDSEVEEEDIEPQYEMTDHWSFRPIEDADPNVVLLTIDDGPDGDFLEMAEKLKDMDASAIFFVNGIFMQSDESREIVKQIHDMGFHIGNHTYNHQNLQEVSEEEQREEIISLNELIEEVIGEKPEYFRAPHGANTDYAKEVVEEEGMLLMNWSYGYDFMEGYMEEEALEDIMVNTELLTNGANLLMHDRPWTNAALEGIVEGLREQGYEILDPNLIQK